MIHCAESGGSSNAMGAGGSRNSRQITIILSVKLCRVFERLLAFERRQKPGPIAGSAVTQF